MGLAVPRGWIYSHVFAGVADELGWNGSHAQTLVLWKFLVPKIYKRHTEKLYINMQNMLTKTRQ